MSGVYSTRWGEVRRYLRSLTERNVIHHQGNSDMISEDGILLLSFEVI